MAGRSPVAERPLPAGKLNKWPKERAGTVSPVGNMIVADPHVQTMFVETFAVLAKVFGTTVALRESDEDVNDGS